MSEVLPLQLPAARIVIVGINYAPEPTGSAPYTAGMAEMLSAAARSVDVVCGIPHYPTWRVEPADRRRLRRCEQRNGVAVHHLRHFVPGRQDAIRRVAWEATFAGHAAGYRLPNPPDLVIASTPSLGGAAVGARLAARHGVPLGVVVQDLVGQGVRQSGLAGGARLAGLAGRVEGALLRRANLIGVVCDSFRAQLGGYGVDPDRVESLPNWTHIGAPSGDAGAIRRRLGWDDGRFVVLHTGNIGLKQDLGNVVAAARISAPDKHFVLLGDGSQRSVLRKLAAGVANLSFLDPVSASEYPQVLAAADLLLVNERPEVGDMSLPSKLTSYLSAGGPILAAVGIGGACATELAKTRGAALVVPAGCPDALAAAVTSLAAAPAARARMGECGRAYAQRHLGVAAAGRRYRQFAAALLAGQVQAATGGQRVAA